VVLSNDFKDRWQHWRCCASRKLSSDYLFTVYSWHWKFPNELRHRAAVYDRKYYGCSKFQFSSKCLENRFLAPNFAFLDENFPTTQNSDGLLPAPQYCDATIRILLLCQVLPINDMWWYVKNHVKMHNYYYINIYIPSNIVNRMLCIIVFKENTTE